MLFTRVDGGHATVMLKVMDAVRATTIKSSGFYYGDQIAPTLVLFVVNCTGLSKFALTISSEPVEEGMEIATAGFPMGPVLMQLEGRLYQLSPTLQTGVISAVLPFPSVVPHGYLINVMVQVSCLS